MNKEVINIGIVSKGRLKEDSEKIFKKKKLKIYSDKRELLGKIKDRPNIRVLFLHAREIIEQIAIGKLDIGISGFDIYKESEINIQNKIKVEKKLNFGFANLVLAVRKEFIDVFAKQNANNKIIGLSRSDNKDIENLHAHHFLDLEDENSIESAARKAEAYGPYQLIIVETGVLHGHEFSLQLHIVHVVDFVVDTSVDPPLLLAASLSFDSSSCC